HESKLGGALGVEQATAGAGGSGQAAGFAERLETALQDGVGIQQQHICGVQYGKPLIYGSREATVVWIGDQADAAAGGFRNGAVNRLIIDHYDFGAGGEDGVETRADVRFRSE